tara:strand:+ start:803 stop:1456 length:654 start_codon:yes stop_codon:yes gene_type:complete
MTSFTLTDLDIIGFASIIETLTLPRVLAPVFQVRTQQDTVLLPPFTVNGDEVFNVTVSNRAEFDALCAQEKLTPLAPAIPAKVNHDLWVNPDGQTAYQPKAEVKRTFNRLFTEHLNLAEEKLAAGDNDAACRHAAIARALKPAHLDPLIIRATAEILLGETSRLAFTRHIAEDIVAPLEFDKLIQNRLGSKSASETRGSAVMRGIATRKPSRFLSAK